MLVAAPPPPLISSFVAAGPRLAFAVGGKQTDVVLKLYRTADGGRSWAIVRGIRPTSPPSVTRGVVFVPSRTRRGAVYERSADGGRTWHASLPLPDSRRGEPGPVQLLDARHAFAALGLGAAAGSSGQALYRSDDGGRTWRFLSQTSTTGTRGALPFGCDKNGVGFATTKRGWAGGYCAGGRPFFYRTDDGGRTWHYAGAPGIGGYCACDTSAPRFFSRRDGAFAVTGFAHNGDGKPIVRVYWTDDGGAHWRASRAPLGRGGPVTFVDARTAWVPGTPPSVVRSSFDRLAVTADGGRRWTAVRVPFDLQQYRLVPVTATVAYAAGERGLLRTEDGGRTWRAVR